MKKSKLVLGIFGLVVALAQVASAQAQGEMCKALTKRVLEEYSKGNAAINNEAYTPTARFHDPVAPGGEWPQGPAGATAILTAYRTAMPDLNIAVTKQYVDGDHTITQWVTTGTHKGPLMGIPATGKPVRVESMSINRCEGGKIVESRMLYDMFGLLVQIGAIPLPAPPK